MSDTEVPLDTGTTDRHALSGSGSASPSMGFFLVVMTSLVICSFSEFLLTTPCCVLGINGKEKMCKYLSSVRIQREEEQIPE